MGWSYGSFGMKMKNGCGAYIFSPYMTFVIPST